MAEILFRPRVINRDMKKYQYKTQFDNKTLNVWSLVFSQLSGVKPILVDNLFKAVDDLALGEDENKVCVNFEKNVNNDLKLQYVIDVLKPVFDNFISYYNDKKNYRFLSVYDENDMERRYYDEDLDEDIRKETALINKSFKKCKDELIDVLVDNGFVSLDAMTDKEKMFFKSTIDDTISTFFESQTRSLETYMFAQGVYNYNILKGNERVFDKSPQYKLTNNMVKAIDTLNTISKSYFIEKFRKTGQIKSIIDFEVLKFIDHVNHFANLKGLHESPLLAYNERKDVPNLYELIESLNFFNKSVFDKHLQLNNELSPLANTLIMERALVLKANQQKRVGEDSRPLKVVLEKTDSGETLRKAVFEKGDLLHLVSTKGGHFENVFKDNSLVASELLPFFTPNYVCGDACYGGVHFLHIPVNYNNFDTYPDTHLDKVWYYKDRAYSTYNRDGSYVGFVFDGKVVDENMDFDMMHNMDKLEVNQRLYEKAINSWEKSANFFSQMNGLGAEGLRIDLDKCYQAGMTFKDVRAITLFDGFGASSKVNGSLINDVYRYYGDDIPIVVNGLVVNNPNANSMQVVSRDEVVAKRNAQLEENNISIKSDVKEK